MRRRGLPRAKGAGILWAYQSPIGRPAGTGVRNASARRSGNTGMAESVQERGVPLERPVKRARTPAGRKATLFVFVFLAITFSLLFAYREVVETSGMSRYLFVIGRHVSFTLGLVGDDCRLEGYISSNRRGGPQALRDEIAAWSRGEEAPWPPRPSTGAEPPITPWENFLHRQLKVKRDLADSTRRLAEVQALASAPADTASLADAQSRLDALKAAASHRLPDGTEQLQGNGQFRQQVRLTESRIESLTAVAGGADRAGEIAEIHGAIGALAEEQAAFLSRQQAILAQADLGMGPRVVYVHSETPERRLQRIRQETERLRAAAAAGDAEAAAALPGAEAERDALTAELRDRAAAADPEDREEAFTFHIIPDCGALQSMIIYFAAVMAFPTLLWKRVAGVAAGLPVLYLINVLRLASLGVIGARYGLETFNFFHEIVWQAIYLVFVVAVWLLWMELLVRPRRRAERPA